jgi:hypothetical protein
MLLRHAPLVNKEIEIEKEEEIEKKRTGRTEQTEGKEMKGVNKNKDTKDPVSSADIHNRDGITHKPTSSLQQYLQWMNTSAALIYIVSAKNQGNEQVLHKEWVVPWLIG